MKYFGFVILRLPLTFLLFTFFPFDTFGQRFYSVVFNQLPQDYQLYPRNEKNEAAVPISGIVEATGYTYMSVMMSRNGSAVKYLRAPITYDSKGIGRFSTEAIIKAELAGYGFRVYACKTTDSSLIVSRQKVVAGDTYVIMGQSNSTGFFNETAQNEYCRTFGKITGTLNNDAYNPADTLWTLSNLGAGVGTMGIEFQKQLSQSSGIPNCLINAGFHWSSAASHATRTPGKPADLNTGYGRMLYRVQKAGVAGAVKAFIYRQGETEAYNEGFEWEKNFKLIYEHLKLDLPSIKKLYVFQIDIIFYPSMVGAELRDYQRRLPDIYPDIRNLATVGTREFDGLHYGQAGNTQGGFELSRLVKRDFYGATDTININSPNIKKVFYKSADKKELILVFDEGQELVYPGTYQPNASTTLEMRDFIYLDDAAGAVAAGTAQGNRITLSLKSAQNASRINYLPPYIEQTNVLHPFTGPNITNKLGMRAFTFYHVGIAGALEIPAISATVKTFDVTLEWTKVNGATSYQLERKSDIETVWKTIHVSTGTTFTDRPGGAGMKFTYRVKAINTASESADYAYVTADVQTVTSSEPNPLKSFDVFPNPVKKAENLFIQFAQPVSGTLSLFDKSGRKWNERQIRFVSDSHMDIREMEQGFYFLRFDSTNTQVTKKILITP